MEEIQEVMSAYNKIELLGPFEDNEEPDSDDDDEDDGEDDGSENNVSLFDVSRITKEYLSIR